MTGSYLLLESETGDFVGQGRKYAYNLSNARMTLTAKGRNLRFSIQGDERWSGQFDLPGAGTTVSVGRHEGLRAFNLVEAIKGGISWSGEGRGCESEGDLEILSVRYSSGNLAALDLRFTHRCERAAQALHGTLHWEAEDTTAPPGPVTPPAGLWTPAAGSTPTSGNYVYTYAEITNRSALATSANAILQVSESGGRLTVKVSGDESPGGNFVVMSSLSRMQAGHYANLHSYPFHNPAKGGMSWTGYAANCNQLLGWFSVDGISYATDGSLFSIELRFEQTCEGETLPLRGKIRWRSDEVVPVTKPVTPVPAGLWEPPATALPASGNYVYLQSETGDSLGRGSSYLHTGSNAVWSISEYQGNFGLNIRGDQAWQGEFRAMHTLTQLQPGFYPDLRASPFHNPLRGALNWNGDYGNCVSSEGWFVVEDVRYVEGVLKAITLRFEVRCAGAAAALNGKVRWRAEDVQIPSGPIHPAPAGLWSPPVQVRPASGNYVYLESDPGDYVGQGINLLLLAPATELQVTGDGARVQVSAHTAAHWNGQFQAMNSLDRLAPGYYGNLLGYGDHNPALGGLIWHGAGRACGQLTGWFVIDTVRYIDARIVALDLRFEQHCAGASAALRGEVHWQASP
ncbi:hypothetical protein [Roseateles sp.]|uniref:hypothetical protein n=1 Tax=Roseateles sp. TaxID=1971397 RepID=UPI00286CECEC|nr:hypothetical protein [Roseateles sp.]